jgi:RecB family endonuclease NucS
VPDAEKFLLRMLINQFHLHKTAAGWQFHNEETLEDFLYLHLNEALGLQGLARQYIIQGQRCDILATDSTQRLIVIELKNTEDRGIVQQLTRYYHALSEEKPFADQINYDLPVHLIAIAPSFHRDNLIDRQYHRLKFQFLNFFIEETATKFYLKLKDIDSQQTRQIIIPHQPPEKGYLPAIPNSLSKILKNCSPDQQTKILQMREKILMFDKRMQEIPVSGSILYGNGNGKTNKYCAEFTADKDGKFFLFLWIPLKCGHSDKIGRALIWTDWQNKTLIEGYITSGIGTELNPRRRELNNLRKKIENSTPTPTKDYWSITQTIGSARYTFDINDGRKISCAYFTEHDPTGKEYGYYLSINHQIAKHYRQVIKDISKNIEDIEKPVLFEEIAFHRFYVELVKAKTDLQKTLKINPYQSLEYLIDLALEKWFARL